MINGNTSTSTNYSQTQNDDLPLDYFIIKTDSVNYNIIDEYFFNNLECPLPYNYFRGIGLISHSNYNKKSNYFELPYIILTKILNSVESTTTNSNNIFTSSIHIPSNLW